MPLTRNFIPDSLSLLPHTLSTSPLCRLLSAAMLVAFAGCGSVDSGKVPVADIKRGEAIRTITLKEFEEKYTETTRDAEAARRDSVGAYREFLNRYIDFRLKVQDALDKGLDKDADVVGELKQYREQLASTYLTEKEVMEKNLRDLYEKRKYEVKAAHIMAFSRPDALPEDTLKAYNKMLTALAELKAGARFDSVAQKYSEDPSAKQNFGDLGYFTGGMMVYQFENAAYNTKVGDVAGPFRTRFGYHLLKVFERRAKTQDIRAAHILLRLAPAASPEDTMKVYERASALREMVKGGADFAAIARDSSDDKGSAVNGGDLGFFGYGRMVKAFQDAAFALKKDGDISPVIRTEFGYHIIKLTERKKMPTLDEDRESLRQLLKRNTEKLDFENDQLVARLKKTYSFTENSAALATITAKLDSTSTVDGVDNLGVTVADRAMTYFSFAGTRSYSVDSLLTHLKTNPQYRGQKLSAQTLKLFGDRYIKQEILNYEVSQLENRYEEFAKLMRDYKDGILLFKVSEQNVWGKATPNDSLAKVYYDAHKDEFKFNERVSITEIATSTENTAKRVYDELVEKKRTMNAVSADSVRREQARLNGEIKKLNKKDKTYKARLAELKTQLAGIKKDDAPRSFEELAKRYSEKINNTGEPILQSAGYQKGEYPVADAVFTQAVGTITAPQLVDGKYYVVRIDGKEAPRPKSFDEARAEAAAKYQDIMTKQLEEAWLKELRAKSETKIYDDNLQKAFRNAPASAPNAATADK